MQKRYTHIFFDLDNTLWDFKTNSFYALQKSFFEFSIQNQVSDFSLFFEVYSKHNKKLWQAYRQKLIVKKDLTRLRFQNTFDEMKIKGIDAENMNELYLSEMPKQNSLVDDAMVILDYLKSRSYILFIITNGFREVQHKKLETANLTKYFKKVFISEDIKSPKPRREIFEYAVKSANAKKLNSLMVGDDWETDIKGALNFGIDAVFFNPDEQAEQELQLVKQKGNKLFCINRLTYLKEIL